jgi:glycosyltransferase 2 family protein
LVLVLLRLARRAGRVAPALVGLAALGGLVLVISPASLGHALERFNPALVPVILLLWVVFYVFQGLRWHLLLAEAGARLRARDSLLLNMAGQTITALLPLGDLTRAALASEAGEAPFGSVVATVTVQELSYTFILILLAGPGVLESKQGTGVLALVLVFMAAVFVVLTVPPVFRPVHAGVTRVPLLRRFVSQVENLRQETVSLLHRPDTFGWAILDGARALVAVAAFWLVIQGLSPGALDWWKAACVLTVANVGGALSLVPGGLGVNEAGVAGLLVLFGVDAGTAGAAALLQRAFASGTACTFGAAAFLLARRRLRVRLRLLPEIEPAPAGAS